MSVRRRPSRAAPDLAATRVSPGDHVRLSRRDPRASSGLTKRQGEARLAALGKRLRALQEVLAAERRRKVLVVLQGMDTSGKDGTISHVFENVNPQGVEVARFTVPTGEELAHDFLWRVHARVPAAGQITIFNRSHYEDVLVPRVHRTIEPEVWRARYGLINAFETILASTGTTVLKFFLHISKKEQKERLAERLADPQKIWKFERGDLRERAHWDRYQAAYEELLEKTSTREAPWFVVPADRKWHRNLVVASALVAAMEKMDLKFPPPLPGLGKIRIR
jgi:PPK2 family polyphosphate:nucleotide phosphotransferase